MPFENTRSMAPVTKDTAMSECVLLILGNHFPEMLVVEAILGEAMRAIRTSVPFPSIPVCLCPPLQILFKIRVIQT
jgi:hypothetical protein